MIEDVTLSLGAADFVGIVGPSGSGKTTLVAALTGQVTPVFGTVSTRRGVSIGYVPQLETVDWNFPVTVFDLVAMAMPTRRWHRRPAGDRVRVNDVLEALGLGGLAGRQIRELSGGQQQRAFIARSLVSGPELLVLDEPASGIDVAARHELLHLLADLHADGTAIVLTTHDVNALAAHLPRVVCFNRTVIADGPPEHVLHPYVLERTFGASMDVLLHGGMPVVLERSHDVHARLRGRNA